MSIEFLGMTLKDILYIIGAIITFLVGFKLRIINTKKAEATLQSNELENVEAGLKIYRLMLQDLQEKLNEAKEAYEVLEERFHKEAEINQALMEENEQLKKKLDEVTSNSK